MCLPRAEDVEPVGSHDPPGVVAKPVVKRFLVRVENLVDPKLMNHVSLVMIGDLFSLTMRKPLSIAEESQVKFSIELPVQFRDIDVMGHVNHATYLQYMETARVELARSLGQVTKGFRSNFILASARCQFKRPITNERRITVTVWVSRIGDGSWDLDYSIHGPRRVEYAVGRTTQVAYDYKTRTTIQISGKLKKGLAKHLGTPLKFRETS
jgi:acyl-CoA thioester hydrolase